MSWGAYQLEPSDILEDRVDSSPILTDRLETWHHAVSIVLDYAQQEYASQTSISSHLAKQRKTVNQLPNFSGSSVTGGTESRGIPQASPGANGTAPTGSGVVTGIASSFRVLAQQNDALLKESENVAQGIKGNVIPPLETLYADLEKHYRTLRSQGVKAVKEIEKSREATTKQLEALGKAVSTAGVANQKPDPRTDPYNLHRRVRSVAAEQIYLENQHSESNLNTQNNFGSLEQHTIEVIQNALSQLDSLLSRYYNTGANTSHAITQSFSSVSPRAEWAQFVNTNKALLVPDHGYQRDPSRVTFTNSDAPSTKPLMEGVLTRKGTVLKGKKSGYYVLTPMGFLNEYKSADYVQDPMPELSLYIPEAQLGGLPAASSGDLSFKISSRDSNKVLGSRHKYTFIAASYDELIAWHQALSRVAGGTAYSVDSLEGDEDEGESVSGGTNSGDVAAVPAADVTPGSAGSASTTQTLPSSSQIRSGAAAPVMPGATTGSAPPSESFTRGVPTSAASTPYASATGLGAGVGATSGASTGAAAGAAAGDLSHHPRDSYGQQNQLKAAYDPHAAEQFVDAKAPSSNLSQGAHGEINRGQPHYDQLHHGAGSRAGADSTLNSAGSNLSGVTAPNEQGHGLQTKLSKGAEQYGNPSGKLPDSNLKSYDQGNANFDAEPVRPRESHLGPGGYSGGYNDLAPRSTTAAHGPTEPSISSGQDSPSSTVAQRGLDSPRSTTDYANVDANKPLSTSASQSRVPHYRISPSKQATLASDHVDGLGHGGSFGGIPVESGAENEAKEAREQDAQRGILDSSGHYDWKKQDLPHAGYHHNPAEGFQEANEHPRSAAHYATASSALGVTPDSGNAGHHISKPISAEPFAVVYPESSVKDEIADEEKKYGNADKFNQSRFKNDDYDGKGLKEVYSKDNSIPEHQNTHSTAEYALPATVPATSHNNNASSSSAFDFDSVKPKDVKYSTPSQSAVPEIAAGNTNPLLGSKTEYSAPNAQPDVPRRDVSDSVPATASKRDSAFGSHPSSNVSEIAAGTVNPLLGSTTKYSAPADETHNSGFRHPLNKADSTIGNESSRNVQDPHTYVSDQSYGDNYQGFHTPQMGSTDQFESPHEAKVGASDLGNKSPNSNQYSTDHHHSRTKSSFTQDTGSRLDPLSSNYEQTGAHAVGSHGNDDFKDATEGAHKANSSLPNKQTHAYSDQRNLSGSSHKGAYDPSTYDGFQDASGSSNTHVASARNPTHHGAGVSGAAGAGATGAGVAGVGAAGAGAAGAGGVAGTGQSHSGNHPSATQQKSTSQSRPSENQTSQKKQEHSSSSTARHNGPAYASGLGGYSSKDYSELSPSKGSDAALGGPGSKAGKAKAKQGSSMSKHGKTAGAIAGGIGAVAGMAGAAGVPGANEVGQAAGTIGQLGNSGVGGTIKSRIPGANEASQIKQAFHGDASGVAKNQVPGANEASQLTNSAKDLKGGSAEANVAEKSAKEAEAGSGGKVGFGKKIANVFK